MRMGPFISLVSETYCLPESSVTVIARVLREAGWLTTGARGVNAPDMTVRDAARLTLSLLSGATPGKVVEEFEFLRYLEATDPVPDAGFTAGSGLDRPHTLEDALVWLFGLNSATPAIRKYGEEFPGGLLWPHITVSLDASARAARICFPGQSCNYEDLTQEREVGALPADLPAYDRFLQEEAIRCRSAPWDSSGQDRRIGMRVIRTIESRDISMIAEAFAGAERPAMASDKGLTDG